MKQRCDYLIRCGRGNRCSSDAVLVSSNWVVGGTLGNSPEIHLCMAHYRIFGRRLGKGRPCPTILGWVVPAPHLESKIIKMVSTIPVVDKDTGWSTSMSFTVAALANR